MDVETGADRFVGIDVSKARVDVHVRPDGTAFGCATDPEGLGALVARLQPLSPCLVVLEAAVTKGWSPPRSPKPACRSPLSIRARCANSPGLSGDWPRPMRSTRR